MLLYNQVIKKGGAYMDLKPDTLKEILTLFSMLDSKKKEIAANVIAGMVLVQQTEKSNP